MDFLNDSFLKNYEDSELGIEDGMGSIGDDLPMSDDDEDEMDMESLGGDYDE